MEEKGAKREQASTSYGTVEANDKKNRNRFDRNTFARLAAIRNTALMNTPSANRIVPCPTSFVWMYSTSLRCVAYTGVCRHSSEAILIAFCSLSLYRTGAFPAPGPCCRACAAGIHNCALYIASIMPPRYERKSKKAHPSYCSGA